MVLFSLFHFAVADICANPHKVVSDSFYFVNDNQLIMHNKAEYAYVDKK